MTFHENQRERIEIEKGIRYWADRYRKTDHPVLKQHIDYLVEDFIEGYPSQLPDMYEHLRRYDRYKGGLSK